MTIFPYLPLLLGERMQGEGGCLLYAFVFIRYPPSRLCERFLAWQSRRRRKRNAPLFAFSPWSVWSSKSPRGCREFNGMRFIRRSLYYSVGGGDLALRFSFIFLTLQPYISYFLLSAGTPFKNSTSGSLPIRGSA
jgi:hypothetical protein